MKVTPKSPNRIVARSESGKAYKASAKTAVEGPADIAAIAGVPDAELTPRVREALSALMKEVAELRAQLAASRTRINELETLADTDPLLGILNRRAFVRELDRAIAITDRYGHPSSLLFIDLDGLKKINDAKGHSAGDAVLAAIAKTLSENIRQTDSLGRLGGDEFSIILSHTNLSDAEKKASILERAISALELNYDGEKLPASVSIGVVELAGDLTSDHAIESADRRMYERKKIVLGDNVRRYFVANSLNFVL